MDDEFAELRGLVDDSPSMMVTVDNLQVRDLLAAYDRVVSRCVHPAHDGRYWVHGRCFDDNVTCDKLVFFPSRESAVAALMKEKT